MATLFTVISLCALVGLLAAEHRADREGVFLFKPIASVGFLGVGASLLNSAHRAFGLAVLLGLVFAAAGDVALMFRGKRSFLVGLNLFLAGHLAYAVAVQRELPIGSWGGAAAVGPPLISFAVLAWLWPRLGAMRGAVVVYGVVITVMVVGAVAFATSARVSFSDGARLRFAVGALSFYASDFAVARERFVHRSFVNRAWGLPAYYVGQLLIASSLA